MATDITTLPDFQRLKTTLASSGIQKWNPPLNEILSKLIDALAQNQNVSEQAGIVRDDPSGLHGSGTLQNPLSVAVDGVTITINSVNKLAASTIPPDIIDRTLWNPITKGRKFGYNQKNPGGAQDTISSGLPGAINASGVFAQQNDITPGTGGVCSHWARGTYTGSNANQGVIYFGASSGPFWECKPLTAMRFRTGAVLNGNDATGTPVHNTQRVYWFGLSNTLPTGATPVQTVPHAMVLCDAPDKLNTGAPGLLQFSRLVSGVQTKTSFNTTLQANTHYIITVQAMSNTTSKAIIEDKTHGTIESLTVSHDNYSSPNIAVDNFGAFCMASNGVNIATAATFDWNSLYWECD